MAKHDTKSIVKTETEIKTTKEDAQAAAREFWANQRINQIDQPQPAPQRSVKM